MPKEVGWVVLGARVERTLVPRTRRLARAYFQEEDEGMREIMIILGARGGRGDQ